MGDNTPISPAGDPLAGPADASVQDEATADEPVLPPHRRVFGFISRIVQAYDRDDVPLLSAAIAFYAVLSVAPILILALAVADAAAAGDAVRRDITQWVTEHMGAGVSELLNSWVDNFRSTDDSRVAVYISIVVLLVSASRLFAHVRTALDRIWHIKSAPPTNIFSAIRTRVLGLGIVGVLGLLLLSSIAVKVVLRMVVRQFNFGAIPFLWLVVDWVIYFFLVGGLIYIMYRRLPHAVVARSHARRGAALTAVLLIVGGELIAFYLARPGVTSSFGAAGSTMALVLWVYYATQVFLVGAIVTWLFAQKEARLRRQMRLRRKPRALKNKKPKSGGAKAAGDDKAATDKAVTDKAATDKAATDKAAMDKAATDKAATDKTAKEATPDNATLLEKTSVGASPENPPPQ